MKLLIVAGGGGHFAAALSVIKQLPTDIEVLVIGRKYAFEADKTVSLEYQTAEKLGIPFRTINTGRLQRTLSKHTVLSLVKVPVGFSQAIKILKEYKPDVVLSFGGYISVPVGLAAKMLNIPIVVHEQVLGAGLANKIVGKFSKKICISWEQSKRFFPENKTILTGNPMKKIEKSNFSIENADNLPIIYITGGSGGAHGINLLIEGCLEKLLEHYLVIHQTGDAREYKDFERLDAKRSNLSPKMQKRYHLTKFVDHHDVFGILQKADLVIARSGINTVTELLYLGKPTLFIPLPHGQRNEQLTNAIFVKQLGLCEIAEQKKTTAESLFALTQTMIKNIESYKQYSDAAKKLTDEDAAQKIIFQVTHVNQ